MVTGASSRRRLVNRSVSVTLSCSPLQGAAAGSTACVKISAKPRCGVTCGEPGHDELPGLHVNV